MTLLTVCGLVSMSSVIFRCTGTMDDDDFGGFEVCAIIYLNFAYVIVLILWDDSGVFTVLKMYYLSLAFMTFFLIILNVTLE